MIGVRSIWSYRSFIYGSVKREFQLKYRNSMLGAAWTVLNPLAMIIVYTVIFSQIMRARLPGVDHGFAYSIYLCAGVLTWGLFSEIITRCQNIFLEHASLLKKVSFPRMNLPIISVLNALVNFAIIFALFLAFLIFGGFWPGWVAFAAIPVLFTQMLFAIGLGMTIGILNVFFRDVGQFFGIFLQFWFWFTPIIYPISILPPKLVSLVVINPMYNITAAYQGIFVTGQWPDWSSLTYPLVLGLVFCAIALRLFRRHSGEIVDEL